LVSHTKGGVLIQGVLEQGAEENYGPKIEEVTTGWRRLLIEELHNLGDQ
jgi:hypothetical protein